MARTTSARPMAATAATQITMIRAGFIDGLRQAGPDR
jgi:hypothetical protein